jgi:uncharacterized protein (DUF736 family)
MAYEKKEGEISIFKNDKKTATNQPDYKGTLRKNGKDFQVALWIKEDKKGNKFFSGKLSEPYVKSDAKQDMAPSNTGNGFDELPF